MSVIGRPDRRSSLIGEFNNRLKVLSGLVWYTGYFLLVDVEQNLQFFILPGGFDVINAAAHLVSMD